jgi:hypothetical protein
MHLNSGVYCHVKNKGSIMNTEAIFAAQTELKELLDTSIAEFQAAYPTVQNVTLQQDYMPEGQAVRLSITLEDGNETITRKV